MECYSDMKKENPAVCYDLDEVWGHYHKWKRSDRERWILCCMTCIYKFKKKSKLTETVDWWLPRTGMQGKWDVVQGYRLSVIR